MLSKRSLLSRQPKTRRSGISACTWRSCTNNLPFRSGHSNNQGTRKKFGAIARPLGDALRDRARSSSAPICAPLQRGVPDSARCSIAHRSQVRRLRSEGRARGSSLCVLAARSSITTVEICCASRSSSVSMLATYGADGDLSLRAEIYHRKITA